MTTRTLDAIAIGSCYVDTHVGDFPFDSSGIMPETELLGGDYHITAGGSAVNFCVLLSTMGLRSAFMGLTGEDQNSQTLQTLLKEHNVTPMLVRRPELRTNIGFNLTNPEGEHIMLVAGTANAALSASMVLPKLTEVMGQATMLYLGGCFKLKGLHEAFGQIVELAGDHDTKLVVDHGRVPAGTTPQALEAVKQLVRSANYYFPSNTEFCQTWAVDDIPSGLKLLAKQAPQLRVVVKDGANGCHYLGADGVVVQVPAVRLAKVTHATGAGDSCNAGIMAALAHGAPLAEAVAHGCRVAAAHISGQPLPTL